MIAAFLAWLKRKVLHVIYPEIETAVADLAAAQVAYDAIIAAGTAAGVAVVQAKLDAAEATIAQNVTDKADSLAALLPVVAALKADAGMPPIPVGLPPVPTA